MWVRDIEVGLISFRATSLENIKAGSKLRTIP